jgi:transposase
LGTWIPDTLGGSLPGSKCKDVEAPSPEARRALNYEPECARDRPVGAVPKGAASFAIIGEIITIEHMKKKKSTHVVFKPYTMGQLQLPTNLEDLIPKKHLVRRVHKAIEKMDLKPLMRQYKGGGTSSYHPKMMLKVLVYAYTQRIYSSRRIAKALRENIHFMWISGNSRPDFRTINRFRGEVLRAVMEEIFASVLELLIEEGYVKLEHYFLDGTKIEANAGKYTYVWAKSTKRYQGQLQEKVRQLLDEIERVNEEEEEEYGDRDLEELGEERTIDAERLEKKVQELNEILKRKLGGGDEEPGESEKKLAKMVKTLKEDCLPRQKKYEEQERTLQGRSSYSKTDEDATFMHMKNDPLRKGQPKPAYNIQVGTEDQFVVGFSVHQRPGDNGCLIPHLEKLKAQLGRLPEKVVADAGYGSEENYGYLEGEGVNSYVKYNTFHQEQKKRSKKTRFLAEQFPYDEEKDEFLCPDERRMLYRKTNRFRTANGYLKEVHVYECESCRACTLRPECTRAKGNRRIQVSFRLQEMRARARDNLLSEEGMALRSRRPVEAESVFGRLKQNWKFRRFLLRGLEKVETEWGLLCIAHNLTKMAAV